MSIVSAAAISLLFLLPAAAQPAPRLANGKPDLSGIWDHSTVRDMSKDFSGCAVSATPGCSAIGFKDIDALLTPYGKAENAKPKFDYALHCLPWGYVRSWAPPYPLEFVQNTNRLVILFEQNNMFHVVPTDGRDHPKNLEPTWMGNSIGKWEGDTLVIDTIGFNGRTWLDTGPERLTSDQLHVIERIERPDFQHLKYEITIDDPKMYTKPWKNTRTFVLMKPGEELIEFSCEENNKAEGHVKDTQTK